MKNLVSWILRILAAVILAQSLFFKFTAHEASVEIFSAIGMEPYGRILIGVLELIAVLLLLFPNCVPYGAILSLGLMSGAIIGHLTDIGIEGELLELFLLALAVWMSAAVLLVLHKEEVPIVRHMFQRSDK